jgi:signal peptidase I
MAMHMAKKTKSSNNSNESKSNGNAVQQKKAASKSNEKYIWLLYLLLVISIAAYILYNNIITGAIALALFIIAIVIDVKSGIEEKGAKSGLKDIGIAVGAAIALWIVLILVLGTLSPVDVVASCSMLPNLQRGDLVFLHGISNFTEFAESNHLPIVNITVSQFNSMQRNMGSEFLAFYTYYSNSSNISYILPEGSSGYHVALFNTECLSTYNYEGENYNYYKCIVKSQSGNLIKYNYSTTNITINSTKFTAIYTSSITIENATIYQNYSNPIIVYKTNASDSFTGDIVHRSYAVIKYGDNYSILTQGDNNQALDIEFENYAPTPNSIIGYVIAKVPYLGYAKLILSGQIGTVAGCNMQLQRQ